MGALLEYEENGVKIQRLPTIGEAESIKTQRQGRQGTLSDNMKGDCVKHGFLTKKNSLKCSVPKGKDLVLTCWSILKHPRSSSGERRAAKAQLEHLTKFPTQSHKTRRESAAILMSIAQRLRRLR